MSLLVRMFLRAPKAADADPMRLSTCASEVREWWTIWTKIFEFRRKIEEAKSIPRATENV
jgi:hypothetical protein